MPSNVTMMRFSVFFVCACAKCIQSKHAMHERKYFIVKILNVEKMETGSTELLQGEQKKGETWTSFAVNIKKLLRLLLIAYKRVFMSDWNRHAISVLISNKFIR